MHPIILKPAQRISTLSSSLNFEGHHFTQLEHLDCLKRFKSLNWHPLEPPVQSHITNLSPTFHLATRILETTQWSVDIAASCLCIPHHFLTAWSLMEDSLNQEKSLKPCGILCFWMDLTYVQLQVLKKNHPMPKHRPSNSAPFMYSCVFLPLSSIEITHYHSVHLSLCFVFFWPLSIVSWLILHKRHWLLLNFCILCCACLILATASRTIPLIPCVCPNLKLPALIQFVCHGLHLSTPSVGLKLHPVHEVLWLRSFTRFRCHVTHSLVFCTCGLPNP